MYVPRKAAVMALLGLGCAYATAQTTIQRVTVFPQGNLVQLEINASGPVTPQAQTVANPDRLVIDFPNSVPGPDLHNLTINRGQVKGLRAGLFAVNPPVTRVVVDLDAPQPYEIFPSGKTIVLKLSADGKQLASASHLQPLATASVHPATPVSVPPQNQAVVPPVAVAPPPPPRPRMSVDYKDGKLKIVSDRASLAEVLTEVRRRTGADISIPPAASQEQVFGTLGPASPRDVMAALLNGSHFNFVMVGTESDPTQLRSLFLTLRDNAPVSVPAIAPPQPSGIVQVPPDPNDNAGTPEADQPPMDENSNPDANADPNADPAVDGSAPDPAAESTTEPDMAPRHRHRRSNPGISQPPD